MGASARTRREFLSRAGGAFGVTLVAAHWPSIAAAHAHAASAAAQSTPAALGGWMQFRGKIEEVMLVGCLIGAWQTNGSPVNGRTLTFALAELWACKVRGASVIVKGTDFEEGMYSGPRVGWYWPDRAEPPQPEKENAREKAVYTAAGLPTPTKVTGPAGSLLDDQIETFASYFCCGVDKEEDKPHLAMPELNLTLEYTDAEKPEGSRKVKAALLCNGLFLVVNDNGVQKFYCHKGLEQSDELSSLIAGLRFKSIRGLDPAHPVHPD